MIGLDGAAGVVLVEGVSDQVALETLAARRGRDLVAERVFVRPIGGAQAIGKVLRVIRAHSVETRVAGLCDAGEERGFRNALERAGLGSDLTRETMEKVGFFVCDTDLEDELVHAPRHRSRREGPRAERRPRFLPHLPKAAAVAVGRLKASFAGSSAAAPARSSTRPYSSRRSTSHEFRGRSTASSRTCELAPRRPR